MSDQNRDKGAFEQAGETMGEMAGRMAGKATDVAMNLTGTVFNSMASMLGTWWSGEDANRAASTFRGDRDRACQNHFQSRSGGREYSTTRPLYQFGHVAGQNPDYQNRSFSEIEGDLRQAWESSPNTQYGRWDDVRDYVEFGYGGNRSGGGLGRTGGI